MTRTAFLLFLSLLIAFAIAAQQPAKTTTSTATRKTAPANDIFSGTVTASSPDSVTVVRKVPARADESREFVVDKDTNIEGKLKANARVTVRFRADADGVVHALRVIVRADAKAGGGAGKAERTTSAQ